MDDLRALRSFLFLSEELHFGRAAARAGISQPALSHQIRRLETELGTALFERTSRSVRLTDAGSALISGARRAVIDVERAERQCRDAAAGGGGHLAVSSIGAALNSIVPPIVRAVRAERPGIAIQLTQMDTPEALSALHDGRIDVAVVRSASPAPHIELVDLIAEPMVVVLPAAHPLAVQETVEISQLRGEDFVLWPRSISESFHDQVIGVCQRAGFSPRVAMEGTDIETQLGMVSASIGVSLQPAGFAALRRVGVVFRHLEAFAPSSQVQIARHRGAPSANIELFVQQALRCIDDRSAWFATDSAHGA